MLSMEEASAYLAELARSQLFTGIEMKTVVRFGQVVPAILTTATTEEADLILLCSHGYSGMKRWVMGSVAERLAHHAPIPVLILREGDIFPGEDCSDSHLSLCILVPLDGTQQAEAAL